MSDIIDRLQEKAIELEISGDNETFELLDSAAYIMRTMKGHLEEVISPGPSPDLHNGIKSLLEDLK